ncbi:MAG: chemotaxis protein CheV [Betaproteobacteria bacterium]|nr:chemotaxis protein CheV [Betaproteobacteria bacterium]
MLDDIDARTRLAGSNKMEILLFSLGTGENFGINVFKVKEVSRTPKITRTPHMPLGVEGLIALRGSIIPVISLGSFVKTRGRSTNSESTMLVTEYSRRTLAFLVDSVDRIIRVDWESVRAPDSMMNANEGLITAVTETPNGQLVSILDVEQVLAKALGEIAVAGVERFEDAAENTIFFADDSPLARRKIAEVLDKMGVQHKYAVNGRDAWEKLKAAAASATNEGVPLDRRIKLILVDAEMPEMDGYVLTRNIKSDFRFKGIPVVMHSSLSSEANKAQGQSVGVDAYVAKFEPTLLSKTLMPYLQRRP